MRMEKVARRDRGRIAKSNGAASAPEQLVAEIERSVQQRTGNRVRELRVEVVRQGVRLQGRCASYYCKQLAQQAVMDVAAQYELTNEIEVA
jgi:osmotically-inducible protein OsmY